jgi:hypothetical protein
MNYLIAVLPNRTQVEAAYSAVKEAELPIEQIAILGQGYQSGDEFGLIDPSKQARDRAKSLAYWLIPFGFAAGYAFNVLISI